MVHRQGGGIRDTHDAVLRGNDADIYMLGYETLQILMLLEKKCGHDLEFKFTATSILIKISPCGHIIIFNKLY